MTFGHIKAQLAERAQRSLLRQRICIEDSKDPHIKVAGKWYINFSSNDYLGVSQLPQANRVLNELPVGSGASPVVTGHSGTHQQLVEYLCQLTGYQDVLLFSSGFAANYAVCQTLMNQGSGLILADKLSHASLIDGARDAKATLKRFRHNDTKHLELLLQQAPSECDKLVVTEGVFSMDGDQAPLAELLSLNRKYNAWSMVDDAHGIGILGEHGAGSLSHLNEMERPEILMATFGKAIGTSGAFVAANSEVIEYLCNFARHYVYSTAFPPLQAALTLQNLKVVSQEHWRREKLQENIHRFRARCVAFNIPVMASETAIQPVMIGNPELTMEHSEALRKQGYWVTGIRTPTVPKHTDRLRITLTTLHSPQQIDALVNALYMAMNGHDIPSDRYQEALE